MILLIRCRSASRSLTIQIISGLRASLALPGVRAFASHRNTAAAVLVALLGVTIAGCAPREDPSRVALRARLNDEARLSSEEVDRLCDEVARTIAGRQVRLSEPGSPQPIAAADPRADVFGMLTDRAGLFDEGLRRDDGTVYRILNAPGRSENPEVEASQRLWIDVETIQPRRYEFSYAFAGYGDYGFDLNLE